MIAILRIGFLAVAIMALAVPASAGPFAHGSVQLHCDFSIAVKSFRSPGQRGYAQAHYEIQIAASRNTLYVRVESKAKVANHGSDVRYTPDSGSRRDV